MIRRVRIQAGGEQRADKIFQIAFFTHGTGRDAAQVGRGAFSQQLGQGFRSFIPGSLQFFKGGVNR